MGTGLPFDPRNHKWGALITVPNRKWTWTCICQTGPKRQVKGAKNTCKALWLLNSCYPLLIAVTLWFYTNFPFAVTVLPRGLNDMAAISSYIHLRFLDVSNNHLTDLSPLASLTQLLWLKARSSLLYSLRKRHLCGLSVSFTLTDGEPWMQLFFCRLTTMLWHASKGNLLLNWPTCSGWVLQWTV